MHALIHLYSRLTGWLDAQAGWLLPSLARFVFAATLLGYFWASAKTKLGDGFFGFLSPSTGAYAQIFPIKAEAVTYNTSAFNILEKLVILGGTWAEFILPLLIVAGLLTRLASVGMIGFILVQSLTDIHGHGADAATIGAWFDRISDAHIMDQRTFWIFTLVVLIVKGAGPLSLDTLLRRRLSPYA